MAAGGAMMGVGMLESGIATLMMAGEVDKARKQYDEAKKKYLPDVPLYQKQYFDDLSSYYNTSSNISRQANADMFSQAMARREQALPGYGAGIAKAIPGVFNLMQGNLPPAVLDNFRRSGAASSVGSGFGGSGFGDLNTALFGARGSLAGMQLGYSLLPSLLGALPQAPMLSPTAWLDQIMNPMQRTQTQLAVRSQNLGIDTNLYSSPTGNEVIYQHMQQEGDRLAGAGSMGMMMGGGGGQKPNNPPPPPPPGGGGFGGGGGGGYPGGPYGGGDWNSKNGWDY